MNASCSKKIEIPEFGKSSLMRQESVEMFFTTKVKPLIRGRLKKLKWQLYKEGL